MMLWKKCVDDNHVLVSVYQALGCMHLPFDMVSGQVPHVSIYRYFKAFPFYSRALCNLKNKYSNDSPAKLWK